MPGARLGPLFAGLVCTLKRVITTRRGGKDSGIRDTNENSILHAR